MDVRLAVILLLCYTLSHASSCFAHDKPAPHNSNTVFPLALDDNLSDETKSKKLIEIHNSTHDSKRRLFIYDAMRDIPTLQNLSFLLNTYQESDDTETKLMILVALKRYYSHFKLLNIKTARLERIEKLYTTILTQNHDLALLRRGIEDMTTIFEPEMVAALLGNIEKDNDFYRKPYLTAQLLTAVNQNDYDTFYAIVEALNACELEERKSFFATIHKQHFITDEQYKKIQHDMHHKPHLPNCPYQLLSSHTPGTA